MVDDKLPKLEGHLLFRDKKKAAEAGERLAEEFHKDMKKCRVFKTEDSSQVQGDFKKGMSAQEVVERIRKAMDD
jgi:hypothetical protein